MAGRNAAELRAAAVATGWFDGPRLNYVGDGASVPWETGYTIGPSFSGSMWIFKAYLDARWPEVFRLHDWLYTPYGVNLIGATQEEADLAMREEIAETDPVSAETVYQACRAFGGPYFGVSAVGYVPPPPEGSEGNIGATGPGREGSGMADYKVVIVFQQTTTPTVSSPSLNYAAAARTAGWTESYWDAGTTLDGVLNRLRGPRTDGPSPILPARAGCLSAAARIQGVRIYEAGVGRGMFRAMAYPGTWTESDVPSMALLCASENPASLSVRRFTMRGIPDNQVKEGEFAPHSNFIQALRTYFESLLNTSYRGLLPQPTYDIDTVSAEGLVTCTAAVPFGVGNYVYLSNVMVGGKRYSDEHRVTAIGPAVGQFTVANWDIAPGEGGKVTTRVFQFFTLGLTSTSAVRITNRKVGRPFAGYRGRSSRRSPV